MIILASTPIHLMLSNPDVFLSLSTKVLLQLQVQEVYYSKYHFQVSKHHEIYKLAWDIRV